MRVCYQRRYAVAGPGVLAATCTDTVTGCLICQPAPNEADCAECDVGGNFVLVDAQTCKLCAPGTSPDPSSGACVCDWNGWSLVEGARRGAGGGGRLSRVDQRLAVFRPQR